MIDYLNMAIIGSGNLAWHLAPALENSGHKISLVYNRNRKNAESLISRLYNATYKNNLDFSSDLLDMVIIAVHDSAIREIASEIILPEDCLLVHTSGSQPIEILDRSASVQYGVLYPLQTFSKQSKVDFKDVPIYIEGNSNATLNQIAQIARKLSNHVYELNSDQRRVLHLSAVFASNFSNHMITIARQIMNAYDLDIAHIKPVMDLMLQKAFEIGPENGQTGPAIRGDMETMDSHMELLEEREDLMELYSIISKHIMATYNITG
jgi:predicted short-subunit dehydrogenase-like oxidoreductase (DUF2520 family)